MSTPGSPMQRGRGRGRQKEMSSSERVSHWVNQREAKRLNRERWANRGSGESSLTGEERHEDSQRQEAEELESGSDRYAAKRYNVQLYVPPSLRAKKESVVKNGIPDVDESSSTCKKADNENECHRSETTAYKTGASEGSVVKSDCEDQQQTSRTKQRGRGRRKPEVEIYVPRALRAGKNESKCFSGIQAGSDMKSLGIEAHETTNSVSCDTKLVSVSQASHHCGVELQSDTILERNVLIPQASRQAEVELQSDTILERNVLIPQASRQAEVELQSDTILERNILIPQDSPHTAVELKSDTILERNILIPQDSRQAGFIPDELQSCGPHTDILHTGLQPHPINELNMHYCSSQSVLTQGPAIESVQDEPTFDLSLASTSVSASAAMEETSNEQSHLEGAVNSLTFEFYDPAVIAFLPSSQYVQKSYNSNTSFSMEVPNFDNSLEIVTEHPPSPVVTEHKLEVDHGADECELLSSHIHHDAEYNCLNDKNETEEQCSDGRIISMDTSLNELSEHIITEQAQGTRISPTKDNSNTESSTIQDDSLKFKVPEVFMSGSSNAFSEHSMADTTHVCVSELSQKDSNFAVQQDSLSSTGEPLPKDKAHRLFLDSTLKETTTNQTDPVYSGHINKKGDTSETNTSQNDKVSSGLAQEEGDTWDSLFDENGDCLDDSLVTELEEYVGKVEIDKPRINYLAYEPKEPEMDFHGLNHILEIYDFSPDLATCDLLSAFREFSARGFDVKWVDDTHALGIFSSSVAANDALKMIHPLLKIRPLSEASKKGQSKAKHCQEFLQPYKARPETTSIAARRLVAGALGMSTQVSREVREREHQKLKEAKEKRRQERKQKTDAWDGSVGKCAMDEG